MAFDDEHTAGTRKNRTPAFEIADITSHCLPIAERHTSWLERSATHAKPATWRLAQHYRLGGKHWCQALDNQLLHSSMCGASPSSGSNSHSYIYYHLHTHTGIERHTEIQRERERERITHTHTQTAWGAVCFAERSWRVGEENRRGVVGVMGVVGVTGVASASAAAAHTA